VTDAPLFTVFTPSYNRAHTLHRVYDSLRAQTLRDFEWLVVDDGSTDNTADLIAGWTKAAGFLIRYFRQEHSGKHIAHNLAAREARGQFFAPLDSDDAYLPHTLERMAHRWNTIPLDERQSFCGVGGLCVDQNGKLVGQRFPRDPLDADMRERHYLYRVRGEKCIAILTELVRRAPFPEIRETNFVPERAVWLEVAKTHKLRWVNETFRVYHVERDGGSLTLTGRNLRESAAGRAHYYVWLLNNNLEYFFHSPKPFVAAATMLPVVARLSNRSLRSIVSSLKTRSAKALVCLMLPIAVLLYAIDRLRAAVKPVAKTT
jgi:glycosyltransferase involved in cell wall biosynthesis